MRTQTSRTISIEIVHHDGYDSHVDTIVSFLKTGIFSLILWEKLFKLLLLFLLLLLLLFLLSLRISL